MALKNFEYEQKRTVPANPDSQVNDDKIRDAILIIIGFCVIYYIFYLLEGPLNTFISRHITLRSEYTMSEQLSKLYLFIIILASVFSYRVLNKPANIKLSISFLILSLSMYMSESNMLTGVARPFFGLIAISFTGFYLLRLRSWLSLIFLIVGFTLVSFGALTDFKHENEFISSLLPSFIFHYLDIALEERYELIGIAFLCLSAILCFHVFIRQFIANNIIGCLLILLASGGITFGNGFLHYQYNPSDNLHLLALVMTFIGFLGLMFTNKRVSKNHAIFTLVTEDLFYTFIFLFFVLLPSIHGRARTSTAFLLWLPIMTFIAINLWRFHPAHQTVRSRQVSDSAIF